jgi:hypothetical protein
MSYLIFTRYYFEIVDHYMIQVKFCKRMLFITSQTSFLYNSAVAMSSCP